MSLLKQIGASGALRTLDHAFAQSLRRLDPATPDSVLAAAALASLAVANGHAGFDPADPQRLIDAAIDWPSPDTWRADLQASRWVTTPDAGDAESAAEAPLVLEGAPGQPGLLYLRRYREYERRLALGLQRIGRIPVAVAEGRDASCPDSLPQLFSRLFPNAAASEDRQARAAAAALAHNLVLITGGPGTGKTTTITRLLVLLAAQAMQAGDPAPRIALSAPTGRAAERMAESVRNAVQALAASGIDPALIAQLPIAGTTLHRLLGTIPDSPRFRHHADNPLPFDVIVIDEASMIDLPLMAKLVEAVADGARLVLLGDPDQLPSVEAGDVLSGILRAAGDGNGSADADAEALRPLSEDRPGGQPIPDHRPPSHRHPHENGDPALLPATLPETPGSRLSAHSTVASRGNDRKGGFAGARVHLQRGWRQSEALQLASLATAVREGDAGRALPLLRGGTLSNVHFHENLADPLQATQGEQLLAHWRALGDATSPAQALALSTRLRVLTAVREGPQGARGLNARIEELLAGSTRRGAGSGSPANRYFHGRLLLITENSYRHRLFNGDIGICLRDEQGALVAWFPGDDPAHPRAFHPAALPAHESAFAMTVHKAQGSEFDEVWLVLPARFNRVLSRELVYTGFTRARQALHVAGSEAVIREALARHASRWSGLGWRLGGQPASQSPPAPPNDAVAVRQGELF